MPERSEGVNTYMHIVFLLKKYVYLFDEYGRKRPLGRHGSLWGNMVYLLINTYVLLN